MVLGFTARKSRGVGLLLLILAWGLLTIEIHGILGHPDKEPATADRQFGSPNIPPGPVSVRHAAGPEVPLCSTCLNYSLLRHSLIPKSVCTIDISLSVEAISIQPVYPAQSDTPRREDRGPPLR